MAWSASRGCTSSSPSLPLFLAQPKTRNSRRALVTEAIHGGSDPLGPLPTTWSNQCHALLLQLQVWHRLPCRRGGGRVPHPVSGRKSRSRRGEGAHRRAPFCSTPACLIDAPGGRFFRR